MELKLGSKNPIVGSYKVLIVPLWNWNNKEAGEAIWTEKF